MEVEWTGARGEWTSREWRVGEFQGATRRHTPGRLAGRAVHSLTPLDPPPLARRPQPGSTRRREWAPAEGESTARHYRARRHFLCGPFLGGPRRFASCGPALWKSPPRSFVSHESRRGRLECRSVCVALAGCRSGSSLYIYRVCSCVLSTTYTLTFSLPRPCGEVFPGRLTTTVREE